MAGKKLSADAKGMIHLNCPSCGKVNVQPIDRFYRVPQPVRVECRCGHEYEVHIEFRKSFRKKTHLEGVYARVAPPGSFEKMTVTDISLGGCRFVQTRHLLKSEDRIKLVFNLDNVNHTKITKDALVCSVDEQSVRCKFLVTGTGLDPEIGFYLRST